MNYKDREAALKAIGFIAVGTLIVFGIMIFIGFLAVLVKAIRELLT